MLLFQHKADSEGEGFIEVRARFTDMFKNVQKAKEVE